MLRIEVKRRAAARRRTERSRIVDDTRIPEIENAYVAVLRRENVVRVDIALHDATRMQFRICPQNANAKLVQTRGSIIRVLHPACERRNGRAIAPLRQ